MNRIFLYLLPIILVIPSLTYADGPYLNIPPTNAFDKINGDNGTVHAANFSMPLNIKGGSNVAVTANNATHTIIISASLASGGAGSYNTTSANNTPVNINGNILNFINGTGNPISIVNSGTKVNITISGSSGTGTITGSENIGKGTTSIGVLSTATATTIRGKNVTSLRPDLITINTSNSTDVNLNSNFKSNSINCAANNFVNAFNNSTGIYNCALPSATGVNSLNFTTSSDFDFHSGNRNVTYTTLDGQVFNLHIKPNVVLTNESAQIIFKALTLNQGILGGNLNVAGFGFSNSGHISSLPLNTGELLQKNGTGAYLSENVHGITASLPITVNGSTNTVNISCPTCGTLSSAITSINSQTGPSVNIVGTKGNITITNSTNQVKINTGYNIAVINNDNGFTHDQTIQKDNSPNLFFNNTNDIVNRIGQFRASSLNSLGVQKFYSTLQFFAASDTSGSEMGRLSVFVIKSGVASELMRLTGLDNATEFLNGGVVVGTGSNHTTTSGSNFFYVPVTSGAVTPAPATFTGSIAEYYDGNANKNCFYNGAWKCFSQTANRNFTASSNKTGVAGFNMLGDGITLTPTTSGVAEIHVYGYGTQNTAASGGAVQIRQITGGCPANGATVTGTALGSNQKMTMSATTTKVPFDMMVQVTGLTLAQKYCFELTQQSITSGTFTVFNVVWSAKEI